MFQVKGYDFNEGVDYHALLQSYKYILRLPGDQLWPRRRGDQQDDQQEVCSSFKTSLGYLLSYSGRSRYQRKRESHAPTQSSVPRWKLQYNPLLMYQGWPLQCAGEEQLHDLLGIHIQHGKLWSQRDFKVPTADRSLTEVDQITPEQVPGSAQDGRLPCDKCWRHRGGLHQVLNLNNCVWRIVFEVKTAVLMFTVYWTWTIMLEQLCLEVKTAVLMFTWLLTD